MHLKLHHLEPVSQVNGPGSRTVIWVQGCSLGCPGCFNPETHLGLGGESWEVSALAQEVINNRSNVEGITLSGGEPLQQAEAVTELLREIRQNSDLSVVLFSGYSWQEIQRMEGITALLQSVDVLIAGRYNHKQRVAHSLIGSANKSLNFLSPRYSPADFDSIPEAEIIVEPDGEIRFSGIDPLNW